MNRFRIRNGAMSPAPTRTDLDFYAVYGLAILHALAEQATASGSAGRAHDERIPERQRVQAAQIDRTEDQFRPDDDDVQSVEALDAEARAFGRQLELPDRRDEILLHDLSRDHRALLRMRSDSTDRARTRFVFADRSSA